jgi:hypothetical protein
MSCQLSRSTQKLPTSLVHAFRSVFCESVMRTSTFSAGKIWPPEFW